MALNQFTFFAAIAKHGSLTRASQELRISQPSVSQQLRVLERDSGVKLYRRGGKGIELTEAGRLFLSRIEPILEQVEQIKSIFPLREEGAETGRLKIGGTFGPSTLLLPVRHRLHNKPVPRRDKTCWSYVKTCWSQFES
jgi:DNA-binding transcriptional LysR family regulator